MRFHLILSLLKGYFQQSSRVESYLSVDFNWVLFNFLLISIESSVKLSFQQNSQIEFSFSCLTS